MPGLILVSASQTGLTKVGGARFHKGDRIVLARGVTGELSEHKFAHIMIVMPESSGGEPQYRIQCDDERFERRIVESEIERIQTQTEAQSYWGSAAGVIEPWLNPGSIKARR